MDSRSERWFLYKKWMLFGFCVANIIVTIIVAAVTLPQLNDLINNGLWTKTKRFFVWIYSGVSIAFDVLGLAGAWRKHYHMSVVYLVLRGLLLFTTIWWSVWWIGRYWINASFNSALIGLSVAFIIEIRRRRLCPTPTFVNPTGQPIYIQ